MSNVKRKAPLQQHLGELRTRVLVCVATILLTTLISMLYADRICTFLTAPLIKIFEQDTHHVHHQFIFTHITEAFLTQLRISTISGIFLASPLIASQVYFFISPGLYKKEKTIVSLYMISAPLLFLLGAVFAYYIVIPQVWKFFLSFEHIGTSYGYHNEYSYTYHPIQSSIADHTPTIVLYAKISEYLDIFLDFILGFGVSFQLPLVILLLAKIGVINVQNLRSFRKYAVIAIFCIAAILTPPDVLSQILLAIPMIVLYEISILCCILQQKAIGSRTGRNAMDDKAGG